MPARQRRENQNLLKEDTRKILIPGLHIFDSGYVLEWLSHNQKEINISLFYKKFLRWYSNGSEIALEMKFDKKWPNDRKDRRNYKEKHLNNVIDLSHTPPEFYEEAKENYYFDKTYSFALRTKTRLLIGFAGSDTVLENSLSLHPLYGFPFISGSSLKGLARHFCKEYEGLDKDALDKVFGSESGERDAKEGEVIFMDAWLDEWKSQVLELDIMTPHYTEYYDGKKFPSDDQDPVPIIFLAVPKGVPFRFCLLPSRTCKDKSIVYMAKCYLEKALKNIGAGAKTGSSYGYFE